MVVIDKEEGYGRAGAIRKGMGYKETMRGWTRISCCVWEETHIP